ncbi:MAG: archease [Candidatus Margulisbacteria bacterium]|nr:archease [Candidatus Margulisiibacteriota bacterium]
MAPLKFKPLEHPSDIGLIAYGKNNKEIFENAAYGMFSLMADLSNIETKESFTIKISGEDQGSLLVNWLNELIFYEDSKKVLLAKFNITKLTDKKLEAKVSGEKINPDKHSIYRPIKAATYNQLQIGPDQAKIIFDV